jgi:hypothetical protein
MKIAITDACIFIDLHELDLTESFFSLPLEIHTSFDVFNELFLEQQEVLVNFVQLQSLTIHNILEEERIEILTTDYPRSLSEMDKTVLFLAKKLDATVLSSDKVIRTYAQTHAIDYHGMLWIFDQLIEEKVITPNDAILKINELISLNIIYQNNTKLMGEFRKRLEAWAMITTYTTEFPAKIEDHV